MDFLEFFSIGEPIIELLKPKQYIHLKNSYNKIHSSITFLTLRSKCGIQKYNQKIGTSQKNVFPLFVHKLLTPSAFTHTPTPHSVYDPLFCEGDIYLYFYNSFHRIEKPPVII